MQVGSSFCTLPGAECGRRKIVKFDDYSGVGVVKHISYDVLKTITLERTRARARTRARSGCHVLAVHVAVAAVAPT